MSGDGDTRAEAPGRRRLPSPAMVLALCALFVAMAGNALALQANSVRSSHIVDGQVKASDIADGAVVTAKLGRGAATAPKLAPASVGTEHLAPGAVGSAAVADGSLGGTDLAPESLAGADLANGAVTGAKVLALVGNNLTQFGFTGADLTPGAVIASKLTTDSVNGSKVVDNSITGDDINEATLGSPLVRNRTQHTLQTPEDSVDYKALNVTCPAGKFLVSGGARVLAAAGTTAAILRSHPSSATTWRGEAIELTPTASVWSLHVYAICVNV